VKCDIESVVHAPRPRYEALRVKQPPQISRGQAEQENGAIWRDRPVACS